MAEYRKPRLLRFIKNRISNKNVFTPYYTVSNIEEIKVAYLGIFKVATTSIKNKLADLSGIQVDDVNTVNLKNQLFEDVSVLDFSQSDCFTFTFVRNPLGRVASVWCDKLAPNSGAKLDLTPYGMYKGIKFEEYIKRLVKTNPAYIDRHLMPQSKYIYFQSELRVKFIGRLERMEEDWSYISRILGTHDLPSRLNQKRKVNFEEYYSPKLRKMVCDYYKEDMALFGYK